MNPIDFMRRDCPPAAVLTTRARPSSIFGLSREPRQLGKRNLSHAWNIATGNGRAAAALALIATAAWLCLIAMTMPSLEALPMPGMAMPSATTASFGAGLAMWEVMVVAMMMPMLALALLATPEKPPQRVVAFLAFAGGYLCVWSMFALLAAMAQRGLGGSARWLLFVLLAAGGFYQWTHVKKTNLEACRSRAAPAGKDVRASFGDGARYGMCCLRCCWLLMAVMIATGMSSIVICLGLTLAMLAERLLPQARHVTGAACVALAAGISMQLVPF
jgi:predicted metal-binding membrane protein